MSQIKKPVGDDGRRIEMKSIVGIFGGYGKFVAALRAKLPVGFAGAELPVRFLSAIEKTGISQVF